MIVLSLYGFRKNKFKLIAAILVLFVALGLLFTSMVRQQSALDAMNTEEAVEVQESDPQGTSPSRGEAYPGEPQRVLNESGAIVEISNSPEDYWSAVLDAVSD